MLFRSIKASNDPEYLKCYGYTSAFQEEAAAYAAELKRKAKKIGASEIGASETGSAAPEAVEETAEAGTAEVALAEAVGVAPMAVGFIVAAVSGYFAIRFMVDIIKKGRLKWFSVYVFILGVILILDQFVLHVIVQ